MATQLPAITPADIKRLSKLEAGRFAIEVFDLVGPEEYDLWYGLKGKSRKSDDEILTMLRTRMEEARRRLVLVKAA